MNWRMRTRPRTERLGTGQKPGDHHYRAYVGPPDQYDLISGLTFAVLVTAGLREQHRVLDLGCGSLRVGRLLIPYLLPHRYFGIEPNRWLVKEGLRHELGRNLVRDRRPRFSSNAEFDTSVFSVNFDFVVAQSVFSHTYRNDFATALGSVSSNLTENGVLIGTFVEGTYADGKGWKYPGCVEYSWEQVAELAQRYGLHTARLRWPHPRQAWFVAGRNYHRVQRVGILQLSHRSIDLNPRSRGSGPH